MIALFLMTLFLQSCAHRTPHGRAVALQTREESARHIRWPSEYEPAKATFFVHNEIEIQASPEAVWEILIAAEKWPEWYEGASDVRTPDAQGLLRKGQTFQWNTMGLAFESEVVEFDAPYRLAWESRRPFIRGYHAWRIIPQGNGCKVITDESQFGTLAVMQKIFIPHKLEKLHDIWLAEMKKRAESQSGKP
jgi:uncharacterized protein YndB with AHSA1/START domain